MTHNITQEYVLLIHCVDGYGSEDERNFTFTVIKNEAPAWTNLGSKTFSKLTRTTNLTVV